MIKVCIKNDLLLRTVKGEFVERPPVWLMRQAGRFLDEYREVRAEAGSFRNMISNPSYAAEVTVQPVDLIGVDAAIIFSDILVIPEALGLVYDIIPGKGPWFEKTIQSPQDIEKLHEVDSESNLDYTYEAIRLVKHKLMDRVPIIGFAGAPWTIFCYMIEGQGSKTFSKAKSMLYKAPEASHQLLQKITDATITYLKGQIAAGADIVKLFDSWAGLLDEQLYKIFGLPYLKQICDAVQEAPKIVFAKGAFWALKEINKLDCQVIAIDWQTSPGFAQKAIPHKIIQGNLDPCQLYATPEEVEEATIDMIQKFPRNRHIANLGHGIYPDLPRESVIAFVEDGEEEFLLEDVRGYRKRLYS